MSQAGLRTRGGPPALRPRNTDIRAIAGQCQRLPLSLTLSPHAPKAALRGEGKGSTEKPRA